MINTLFGIKKNMTSAYDARGRRVGATVLEVVPNVVTQVKTQESKDGYNAVQLGVGTKKTVNKPRLGLLKKAGVDQKVHWLKEVRTEETNLKPGEEMKIASVFQKGDEVKVTGISKGKGFQGVVRRHGFAGGPKTHGQSDRWRAPGAVSSGTTIGRVLKGKKMAGHMGHETTTVSGLEVVSVDRKNNLLVLKGAVPGNMGALVRIIKTGKIKGYTPPPEPEIEEEEEMEAKETQEQSEQQPAVKENQTEQAVSVQTEGESGE